jgi:Ni/Fe-hydrogenase subunit HybB-like protein
MYFPSPVEVFLALGLIAMGLLIITIAVKILPLQVPEDQLHEHEEEEVYVEAMEKTSAADAALEGGSAT